MSTNPEVQAVPVDKLPAEVIMQQLGYRTRVVPKRKDRDQKVQRHADVKVRGNERYINNFDTFWSSVRVVRVKNPKTAPVGSIHRGARNADAAHVLALLGKETK